jgi:hypothetical protein
MATPVGTILCVGMLGLASFILFIATVASAFVTIPVEDWDSTTLWPHSGDPTRAKARRYTTAV